MAEKTGSPEQSGGAIDAAPLDRLLELAGPATGKLLVTTLLSDLETARKGLDLARIGPDFASIRTHSHVLIALAGTIGDRHLQRLSEQLNAAAHAQDSDQIAALTPEISAGIGRLKQFVADAGSALGGHQ